MPPRRIIGHALPIEQLARGRKQALPEERGPAEAKLERKRDLKENVKDFRKLPLGRAREGRS